MNSASTMLWIALLTLAVVGFQTYLLIKQGKLADKQLEIIGRRSNLEFGFREGGGVSFAPLITAQHDFDDNARFELRFCSHNKGSKGSRDYYFTILLPQEWNDNADYGLPQRESLPYHGVTERDGKQFRVYQVMVDKPLYPGRWGEFAIRSFWAPYAEYPCHWHMSDEDGEYPGRGKYGKITVIVAKDG